MLWRKGQSPKPQERSKERSVSDTAFQELPLGSACHAALHQRKNNKEKAHGVQGSFSESTIDACDTAFSKCKQRNEEANEEDTNTFVKEGLSVPISLLTFGEHKEMLQEVMENYKIIADIK